MPLSRGLWLAAALFCAGLWLLPWHQIWGAGFAGHMSRHMILVALLAPALALSLPPGWARWAPPVLLAAAAEFAVVWAWHLPGLHGAARAAPHWFALEQASFLAAGLAIWTGALRGAQPLAGAGGLLLTSMHMTALGALLILAPAPLYPGAHHGGLAGQQMGGMIMLALGTPIYLLAGLWLTGRALRPDGEAA